MMNKRTDDFYMADSFERDASLTYSSVGATAALNNLSGAFSGNNEVTLNLDGNVLGQIMVPYVNNGLAKIFVQSNR